MTFDLTGLPPAPAEINAFLADESPNALETVVDRLLASSAFGERWGQHWLDVARYGESTGSARNLPFPQAWKYRDYVIDSLNKDKPYDQFVREQVAGDLLPYSSEEQRREQLTATGFLALGVKDVNQRFKVRYVMDNIDEQINTVSRSVLGLSSLQTLTWNVNHLRPHRFSKQSARFERKKAVGCQCCSSSQQGLPAEHSLSGLQMFRVPFGDLRPTSQTSIEANTRSRAGMRLPRLLVDSFSADDENFGLMRTTA